MHTQTTISVQYNPQQAFEVYADETMEQTVAFCFDEATAILLEAAPKLLAACETVEWVWIQGHMVECCPWCNATKLFGHEDDCIRQAAIAAARGAE